MTAIIKYDNFSMADSNIGNHFVVIREKITPNFGVIDSIFFLTLSNAVNENIFGSFVVINLSSLFLVLVYF